MELHKTDPTCANIDLIDENSCVGNSLDIINTNVVVLSSNLLSLSRDLNNWQALCTTVNQFSATMQNMSLNIQRIIQNYYGAINTVQTLSASWSVNEFSLYYPKILNYNTWSASPSANMLLDWVKLNFPTNNYSPYQVINLFVKLYYDNTFNFKFSESYLETCKPSNGTVLIQCKPCPDPRRTIGCNQDIKGQHICSDAKTHCTNTTPDTTVNFSCPGSGGSKLNIKYQASDYDRFVYKTISYELISNPDPYNPGKFEWVIKS
jgi:hypothetical protein